MKVNPDLYDFMKENEIHLFGNDQTGVEAWMHINFCDLEDFVKIVGREYFEDGGVDVKMLYQTVCVDVADIIENLSSYKNCFDKEWNDSKK